MRVPIIIIIIIIIHPIIALIFYILLSHSVFTISMLILWDRNFHATNSVMFLRFYYKQHWRKMFSIFLLKQVKYFLADKNTCVILCEFLNKVYYYYFVIIIIIIM